MFSGGDDLFITSTVIVLSASFQADPPPNGVNKPTPAQVQTADLAGAQAALQVAQIQLADKSASNFWNVIIAVIASGGGVTAIFGAAMNAMKARHDNRMQEVKLDSDLSIAKIKAELDNKIALAKFETEQRASGLVEDNAVIKSLREELSRLQDRLAAEEKRTVALQDQVNRQSEQIVWMQMHGNESPFIGWSVDTQNLITHVTAAFERQILAPLKMTRGQVIGKKHSEVWSKEFSDSIAALDDAASVHPDHSAWGENITFSPKLGLWAVCKTVLRYNDRPVGLSGIAIRMTSKVDRPEGPAS